MCVCVWGDKVIAYLYESEARLFLTGSFVVRVGADIVDRTVGRVRVALFVTFWLSLCGELSYGVNVKPCGVFRGNLLVVPDAFYIDCACLPQVSASDTPRRLIQMGKKCHRARLE